MNSWTVLSLLNWTIEYFTKNKLATPRLDAEVLLAHMLGIERIQLYVQFERPMAEGELTAFKLLIQRRVKGEPVSYIRGKKEFWSMPFKVGPGVLVPRPDTEVLVEQVIRRGAVYGARPHILDIGTGSGNIPIALAKAIPASTITAIDISEDALNYARENATANGVAGQIQFIQHDFLSGAGAMNGAPTEFDILVSNPPYLTADFINHHLEKGIKDFEPLTALEGGTDGLDFYRKIGQSCGLLKTGGLLAVEIGEDQAKTVREIFEQAGVSEIEVTKDYAGLPRVVTGKYYG